MEAPLYTLFAFISLLMSRTFPHSHEARSGSKVVILSCYFRLFKRILIPN